MPKVILDPAKRKTERLLDYIYSRMDRLNITQLEMARELGLSSQAAFARKKATNYFTVEELVRMLIVTGSTFSEIGEFL